MTHLTLTGHLNSKGTGIVCPVLCGAPRTSDNQYLHAMYAPQSIIDSEECCPECRKVWNDAANDDES